MGWIDDARLPQDFPVGVSGNWAVEHFTVSESAAKLGQIRSTFSFGKRGWIEPGIYTRLICHNDTIMSDTPEEVADLRPFYWNACGHTHLNGLGLGVAVGLALKMEKVEKITVLDISTDVINLVGEYWQNQASLAGKSLQIICGDALTWKPEKGTKFDFVWHDIWPTICSDHAPEMSKLHRRFGRWCSGNQDSWCRYQMMERQ